MLEKVMVRVNKSCFCANIPTGRRQKMTRWRWLHVDIQVNFFFFFSIFRHISAGFMRDCLVSWWNMRGANKNAYVCNVLNFMLIAQNNEFSPKVNIYNFDQK